MTARTEKRASAKPLYLFIMAMVLMAVFTQFASLFFVLAMLPAAVAYLVDLTKRRHLFRTVAGMNLAGTLPYLTPLVMGGSKISSVFYTMQDPFVWLVIYGSAALGWIMHWAAPHLSFFVVQTLTHQRVALLESQQRRLVEEWGNGVKGRL